MKIQVKDLIANPYRNISKYPIDKAKVEALKTSIKDTSFWDNILVRKAGNKYQIAYGHHRWIALKELSIKQIDIPVRDILDAQMVKIMAEENLDWATSPAVVIETVLAAKKFLDAELAKYDSLDKCHDKTIRALFAAKKGDFKHCKRNGVGRATILKFLGGNWKEHMIQNALDIIRHDNLPAEQGGVSRDAIETIPTMEQAKVFRTEARKYKLPKPTQKKLALRIAEEGIGKRGIPAVVRAAVPKEALPGPEVSKMQSLISDIDTTSRALKNKIMQLRKEMQSLGVTEVKGVKVLLAKSSLKQLSHEIVRLGGTQ
jgi:ParB-like chromosome segregation protein Spo0J